MKSEMIDIIGLAEMLNKELNQIDNGDCYIGEYKNLKKMEKEVRKIMKYILERKNIILEMNIEEYEEEINKLKNEVEEEIIEEFNYFLVHMTMKEALFFILKKAKEDFKAKSKEEKRNVLTFAIPYTTIIEKMNYDLKRIFILSFVDNGDK